MAKTVREQNLAFKQQATEALHARADAENWCSSFDLVLSEIGLPARDLYVGPDAADRDYWVNDCGLKGPLTEEDAEPTRKAFEAWRLQASAKLAEAVRTYGLATEASYERLRELGFTTPERKDIVIEGTFTHTQSVYVVEGEDVIDKVDVNTLGQQLRAVVRWNEDRPDTQVTWKAKVADPS